MKNPIRTLAIAMLATLAADAAYAVEVEFEGTYRARGRLYDTLSLERDLPQSEGLALYGQHRLWLRPSFRISDQLALFAEIRGLDNAVWGRQALSRVDPVTGLELPREFQDDLVAPAWPGEGSPAQLDFTLWRAWGEVHTGVGTFRAGRMPLHWGAGVWQNDGLGWNAEYGDSADRVEWEHVFTNVFARVALDTNVQRLINEPDTTTHSYNAALGYRTERVTAGFNGQLRRAPHLDFNLWTISGAIDAEIGPIDATAEVVGRFGGGNLETGATDVRVGALGGVLQAQLHANPWRLGLQGGFATGDGDDTDQTIRTFTFHRDYNMSLVLFQQPMPILSALVPTDENLGRSFESTLLGPAVSNALFIRPSVTRMFGEDWEAEGAVLAARVARLPERIEGRRNYGLEFNATGRYLGIEGLVVSGTYGLFMPGTYFRDFQDDTFTGFSGVVHAGQLIGEIRF